MKKWIILACSLFITWSGIQAQIGYGLTARTELYSWYGNPSDDIASRSAGSALLNLGLGPKLWVGGEYFSVSTEAYALISPFALSLGDYKGLGAVSFPVMAKMQFLGMSNFNSDGRLGFAIGGGMEWSKTELFYLKNSFEERGVQRKFFKTYVVELDVGFGLSGFNLHGYVRYGFHPDTDANTFHFGVGYDFNLPVLKEAADPEF